MLRLSGRPSRRQLTLRPLHQCALLAVGLFCLVLPSSDHGAKWVLYIGRRTPASVRRQRHPVASTTLRASNSPDSQIAGRNIVGLLSKEGSKLLLLGTAHISASDVLLVRRTVKEMQPDAVVVELDAERLPRLNLTLADLGDLAVLPERRPAMTSEPFFPLDPRGWAVAAAAPLVRLMMMNMYNGMTAKGMQAGGEFAAAIDEGRAIGARLVLGDIESVATIESFLQQVSRSNPLDLMQRYSTVMQEELGSAVNSDELTPEVIEQLKADVAFNSKVFERLRAEVPEFYDTFIGARDTFMADAIAAEDARGSRAILAVVGLGHLPGMEAELVKKGWTSVSQL